MEIFSYFPDLVSTKKMPLKNKKQFLTVTNQCAQNGNELFSQLIFFLSTTLLFLQYIWCFVSFLISEIISIFLLCKKQKVKALVWYHEQSIINWPFALNSETQKNTHTTSIYFCLFTTATQINNENNVSNGNSNIKWTRCANAIVCMLFNDQPPTE